MSSEAEIVERLRKRVAVEMCSFGPNKPFDIGANDGPNWMRYLPKAEQVTAEAAALIRELSGRVERTEGALKVADGTIHSLARCGVRAPCAQCDYHILHGRKAISAALSGDA